MPKTSTSMSSGAPEEAGNGVGVGDDGDLDLVPLMEATAKLMPSMVMGACGTT